MRVLHVAPGLDTAAGGVAGFVLRLATAQAAEPGVEVTIATTGETLALAAPGCTVIRHPRRAPRRLARSPGLRSALRSVQADVVHAHGLWQLPLGYAAAAARRIPAPLVISPHGMLSPWARRRSRLRKWAAAHVVHPGALGDAAAWHAASDLEAGELRALGHRQPIAVAPAGLVEPEPGAAERAREHYLGAAPELRSRRVLLFYSRFHPKKRVRELIGDFRELAPRHPEWQLLVVGLPETDTVEGLRALARRFGLGDRVTVLDGRGAPAPYPLAELFVLPSHSENFALVVLEALAHGLPVVAGDATPWAELDAAGAGACVPLAELRGRLSEWMSRPPEQLREAGARGRARAGERFDWRASARRLLELYRRLSTRPVLQG